MPLGDAIPTLAGVAAPDSDEAGSDEVTARIAEFIGFIAPYRQPQDTAARAIRRMSTPSRRRARIMIAELAALTRARGAQG